MMRPRVVFSLLFVAVLATRLCHLDIVWVEEGYPSAAALAVKHGAWLYRDLWFDKPPLFPLLYLLWDASTGFPLRLAGALYITLASFVAYRFARSEWGEREGLLAAALLAFFLTFSIPSAALVLGPDLLFIVPHLLAVHGAWRGKALASGFWCGIGLLLNGKAIFAAAICGFWLIRHPAPFAAGLLLPQLTLLPVAGDYWRQVWAWGFLYSRDSFVTQPWREGLIRTANWLGFHAAAVAGSVWFLKQGPGRRRWLLWLGVSLLAVLSGTRFFPRYYFQLLPIVVLLAARGIRLIPRPALRLAVLALLLIPLARFGPRYALLAGDLLLGRPHQWSDLAMEQDSRAAAAALPGCRSLFVWGYRPEIYALSRCVPGTPFLDSQPVTGVLADRHLTDSRPTAPALARENRVRLAATRPHYVIDGLGPYNPDLALTRYPDLAAWLAGYTEVGRTSGCIIYRLAESPSLPTATR